jgi:ribosomal protein S11
MKPHLLVISENIHYLGKKKKEEKKKQENYSAKGITLTLAKHLFTNTFMIFTDILDNLFVVLVTWD